MTATSSEVEWQLEAPDLQAVRRWVEQFPGIEGVTIKPARNDDHLDTYLDTGDRRLDSAGFSARLRRRPDRPAVATLKSLNTATDDGPLVRLELEEETETDEPSAVARASGPLGERIRELIGADELVRLFDLPTHRQVFPLETTAGDGELVLDETEIRKPDGPAVGHLSRVEVEVPESAVGAVRPLVERLRQELGLHATTESKYQVALAIIRNG